MNRAASMHFAEARNQIKYARLTKYNKERVKLAQMFHGLARAALQTHSLKSA